MKDQTLPMKGGWIMVTKLPPTAIQPALFGVYYAKPEKVFERGAFTYLLHSAYSDHQLKLIYKHRQGAKLRTEELDSLRAIGKTTRLKRAMAGDESPIWQDLEDEQPPEIERDLPTFDDLHLEMRVRVLTTHGEVCLEPHEYSIIADMQAYIDCIGQGMLFHELGGIKNAKKLSEQLFYVMSRGIPKTEAYKMLLGDIDRWNVFWLEPDQETRNYFTR